MLRRVSLSIAAIVLVLSACSDDDEITSPVTTNESPITTPVGTSSLSSTTSSSEPSTGSTESIPPVTPPANQPEACAVLAAAAALDAGDLTPDDQPSGQPAPSTGCRATASGVALALFYGQDPLETLAVARVQHLGGTDIAGIGQDAYYASGTIYVDTGSRAFAVTGDLTQEQLEELARDVISNL